MWSFFTPSRQVFGGGGMTVSGLLEMKLIRGKYDDQQMSVLMLGMNHNGIVWGSKAQQFSTPSDLTRAIADIGYPVNIFIEYRDALDDHSLFTSDGTTDIKRWNDRHHPENVTVIQTEIRTQGSFGLIVIGDYDLGTLRTEFNMFLANDKYTIEGLYDYYIHPVKLLPDVNPASFTSQFLNFYHIIRNSRIRQFQDDTWQNPVKTHCSPQNAFNHFRLVCLNIAPDIFDLANFYHFTRVQTAGCINIFAGGAAHTNHTYSVLANMWSSSQTLQWESRSADETMSVINVADVRKTAGWLLDRAVSVFEEIEFIALFRDPCLAPLISVSAAWNGSHADQTAYFQGFIQMLSTTGIEIDVIMDDDSPTTWQTCLNGIENVHVIVPKRSEYAELTSSKSDGLTKQWREIQTNAFDIEQSKYLVYDHTFTTLSQHVMNMRPGDDYRPGSKKFDQCGIFTYLACFDEFCYLYLQKNRSAGLVVSVRAQYFNFHAAKNFRRVMPLQFQTSSALGFGEGLFQTEINKLLGKVATPGVEIHAPDSLLCSTAAPVPALKSRPIDYTPGGVVPEPPPMEFVVDFNLTSASIPPITQLEYNKPLIYVQAPKTDAEILYGTEQEERRVRKNIASDEKRDRGELVETHLRVLKKRELKKDKIENRLARERERMVLTSMGLRTSEIAAEHSEWIEIERQLNMARSNERVRLAAIEDERRNEEKRRAQDVEMENQRLREAMAEEERLAHLARHPDGSESDISGDGQYETLSDASDG